MRRDLIILALAAAACLLARHALGFSSVVEMEIRRGTVGTVRFDTQNQKFAACVSDRCAEVIFR